MSNFVSLDLKFILNSNKRTLIRFIASKFFKNILNTRWRIKKEEGGTRSIERFRFPSYSEYFQVSYIPSCQVAGGKKSTKYVIFVKPPDGIAGISIVIPLQLYRNRVSNALLWYTFYFFYSLLYAELIPNSCW